MCPALSLCIIAKVLEALHTSRYTTLCVKPETLSSKVQYPFLALHSGLKKLFFKCIISYYKLKNVSGCADKSKEGEGTTITGVSSKTSPPALIAAIEKLDVHSDTVPRGLFAVYRTALQQLMEADGAVAATGTEDP